MLKISLFSPLSIFCQKKAVVPVQFIVVQEYDPVWPARFAELAARLHEALSDMVLRVEHVGSTAVPGLAAKPIIDIDVVMKPTASLDQAIGRLARIGYVHQGDLGIPGREAFRCRPGESGHHLYLLGEDAEELRAHLAFRDKLRADPVLRGEYALLKRSLAARVNERDQYTDGKTKFIRSVLDQ
jgi:GrpB-like predicted nucleotidyltransferase (UPF0157 family)